MNVSSDTVSKMRDCNRKKRIFFFWWFLTWNQPLPFFASKSCVDHSGTEMSATISTNHFKMPRFPCVCVCLCVVFYDQIRIDQKWHCANLLVLNILAESSFSCSEALGGQGLMLPFETCRKHTNTHMSTKQKDRGRGEKEITMRFSASQSSPPHRVVWKPWPRWPQRPPSAGLRLSDSNWLGMAGGNKQSRTGPTWQRQCMESNGSFNNYSPYPATTKPI